ncbi:MAG: hypothetical protein ACON4O_03030 [Lentimonas sp.]
MLKVYDKTCLKGILFICAFAFTSSLVVAQKKEEPVDLSILRERDQIARTMDQSARIKLLKIEAVIEKATSDVQSAQYQINTKPTPMRGPDEVKQIVKNGETLLAKASAELDQGQRKLVAFLSEAKQTVQKEQAAASKRFSFALESASYDAALGSSMSTLLNSARNRGYKVLFDTGFLTTDAATTAFKADARNATYDKLVAVDGVNFTVNLALELQLGEDGKFSFENSESFGQEKLALLAIEVLQADDSNGHLVLKLVDVSDFRVIDLVVTKISNIPELIDVPVETTAEPSDETEEASREIAAAETSLVADPIRLAVGADITDNGLWIDRLATQSYNFKIVANTEPSVIPAVLLMDTVLENTSMKVIDTTFADRAYGSEELEAEAIAGAELTISSSEETLKLSATSYSNNRVLEIGTMQISYE